MDNKTPEISQPQENPKIPMNWKFNERNDPGLKVREIDLDQRFIAFDLSKDPDDLVIKPRYGDYFFDHEGKSLVNRRYFEEGVLGIPSTCIDLVGDQIIYYRFDWSEFFYDGGRLPTAGGASVFFKDTSFIGEKEAILGGYFLGEVYYNGQRLDSIAFGNNFATDSKPGKHLYVPRMGFDLQRGLDLVLDPKIRENQDERLFFEEFVNPQLHRDQNRAVYLDKNGDKILLVDWKIEEDELNPSKGLFAVVSQTHIPSGIVKTLRAPLRLDMRKIKEAVFVRPPYQKDERGRLIVPWTEIDRIVGASVSYSYPPPKKS